MTRSKKITSALATAFLMSAGFALAPTASFAATTQHSERHDNGGNYGNVKNFSGKQTAMRGHDNNYRGGHDGKYHRDGKRDRDGKFRHHRYTDRMHRPAQRFERIALEFHPGFAFHAGHWQWQVNHWHWIAGSWQHR